MLRFSSCPQAGCAGFSKTQLGTLRHCPTSHKNVERAVEVTAWHVNERLTASRERSSSLQRSCSNLLTSSMVTAHDDNLTLQRHRKRVANRRAVTCARR